MNRKRKLPEIATAASSEKTKESKSGVGNPAT
jgi:hypothetical protein